MRVGVQEFLFYKASYAGIRTRELNFIAFKTHTNRGMLFIHHNSLEPAYNLALEEYLSHHQKNDYAILWQNKPTVVVGKHQNLFAESYPNRAAQQNVAMARRISGGGTVYHDSGNLNFSFIQQREKGKQVDFKAFIQPISDFLNSQYGLNTYLSPRSDLMLDGYKFSGNAEHVYKQRVLHHGTLLFNANLDTLAYLLRPDVSAFSGRTIGSVRSKVCNLHDALPNLSFSEFRSDIQQFIQSHFCTNSYTLSPTEHAAVQQLAQEKHSSWEWVYAYSPNFDYTKTQHEAQLRLQIQKGSITAAESTRNGQTKALTALLGLRFLPENLALLSSHLRDNWTVDDFFE